MRISEQELRTEACLGEMEKRKKSANNTADELYTASLQEGITVADKERYSREREVYLGRGRLWKEAEDLVRKYFT